MTNLFQHLTTKNTPYTGSTKVDHLNLSFHATPAESEVQELLDLLASDNARGLASGNPQRVNNLQHLFNHDGGQTRKAMFLMSQLRDAQGRQVYKLSHGHGEATIQLIAGMGAPTQFATVDLTEAPAEAPKTEEAPAAPAPAAPAVINEAATGSADGEAELSQGNDSGESQNADQGTDTGANNADGETAPTGETQTDAAPAAEGTSTDAGSSEGSESKDAAPVTAPEAAKTEEAAAAPAATATKKTSTTKK